MRLTDDMRDFQSNGKKKESIERSYRNRFSRGNRKFLNNQFFADRLIIIILNYSFFQADFEKSDLFLNPKCCLRKFYVYLCVYLFISYISS